MLYFVFTGDIVPEMKVEADNSDMTEWYPEDYKPAIGVVFVFLYFSLHVMLSI